MTHLTEIEERAKKATEGPWEWSDREVESNGYVYIPQGSTLGDTLIQLGDNYEGYQSDCDFIAHSREDIPYLLSLLRSAEEALQDIGNSIGGPTMDYAPEVKMRELEERIVNVSKLVQAALCKIREEGGRGK